MNPKWPPKATEKQVSLRLFKGALMKYSAEKPYSFLSNEDETVAKLVVAKVEDAYAKVREHAPEELDGNDAPRLNLTLCCCLRLFSGIIKSSDM